MNAGAPFNPTLKHADIVDRQKQLPASAKMQYRRLVRYSNGKGVCFPALETLSVELGLSVRQVERNNAILEAAKLLEHRRGGRGRSNTYYFLWHEIFEHLDTTSMSHQDAKNVQSRCDINDVMIGHPRRFDATSASNESVMNSLGSRHAKAARLSAQPPPPSPTVSPAAPATAPAPLTPLSPADKINVILAEIAPPDSHLRTARRLLEGENPSELPKVPRHFAQRLAPAASQFLGRPIAPEDLEQS
jgi:hypothetical protein